MWWLNNILTSTGRCTIALSLKEKHEHTQYVRSKYSECCSQVLLEYIELSSGHEHQHRG